MKTLKKMRSEALKVLKNRKSSINEKKLANMVLALSSGIVVLEAQRNNWLDAFCTAKDLENETKRKCLEETDFVEAVLKGRLKFLGNS